MKKQYIGLVRDHSGSMAHLATAALADYNNLIDAIKKAADREDIDTIASAVECGRGQSGEVRTVIRSRKDGAVYAGQSARDLLNLPTQGTIKLSPGDFGDWEIFIQSTSSNRHLPVGTKVLYWKNAGR